MDDPPATYGLPLGSFAGVRLFEHWIDGGAVAGATATVDTAGAIDRRLSLTRVAMTGGLGLFWKKKVDKRELYLLVEGQTFTLVKQIDPDEGLRARNFAAQITRVGSVAGPPPMSIPATTAKAEPEDPTELIRKLGALRDQGLLTDEEFAAKKALILGL